MADSATTSSSGIGFGGLLTILFVALKLLGKITWSWWWVLCPIWIPLAAIFITLLLIIFCKVVLALLK